LREADLRHGTENFRLGSLRPFDFWATNVSAGSIPGPRRKHRHLLDRPAGVRYGFSEVNCGLGSPFHGAGTTLASRAKRKEDQVIENKQSRAMTDFAPPMISRTYERVAKPLVSPAKGILSLLLFSAASRPRTQGPRNPGGFRSEMAPQATGIAKPTRSRAPGRFAVEGRENRPGDFVSVLDHRQVRGGRVFHPDDMVSGVDVDNFAGDAARHG
jgi:hypothetical protein